MKIRTGFVSNSSSSSFVVAFPRKPKSAKEVQKILFGNHQSHEDYSTEMIAKRVFKDIQESKIDISSISEKDIYAVSHGADSWTIAEQITKSKDFYEVASFLEDISEKGIVGFLVDHKDKFITHLSYSDNDGDFDSMMEHSGIFDNIYNIRISKH